MFAVLVEGVRNRELAEASGALAGGTKGLAEAGDLGLHSGPRGGAVSFPAESPGWQQEQRPQTGAVRRRWFAGQI